jgi:L-ascorbate metabolism protein UlaG (beta-lactamase superfamily)
VHPFAKLSVQKGSVGIHWFEQNSYAIKDHHSTIVLIDPYFPHNRPADVFVHTEPPLDESQLPINYVLVTHAHGDHTCSETLGRIHKYWSGAKFVGPKESIKQILEETDINENLTITIASGGSSKIGTMKAYAVYAKSPEGDPNSGIDKPDVTHLGYVVEADGIRLYFSGDEVNNFADNDELVKAVAELHPDIGFLTTHPSEGEFPFTDGSIKMAQHIGLKTAVPAHYSCFVKRDYDPQKWAEQFPPDGPKPLIIPANSHIIYTV